MSSKTKIDVRLTNLSQLQPQEKKNNKRKKTINNV